MAPVLRSEYPRPDFVRPDWLTLNGEWEFAYDDQDQGLRSGWQDGETPLPLRIQVPFPHQSQLSGLGDKDFHPVIWYRRHFRLPAAWEGQRILLHFGAVDYEATVWVNGHPVATNRGGYVPFTADITGALARRPGGEHTLVVRVVDETRIDQPLGKQSARLENWGCWYTRVSGIWQSVWLEPVSELHLRGLRLIPDIDAETLTVAYDLSRFEPGLSLELVARFEGRVVAQLEVPAEAARHPWTDPGTWPEGRAILPVPSPRLWSPEHPHLYDLTITLKREGQPVDRVETYFGMRKIATADGRILLNNRPYYLRMVLDQGYWPDGIYTPADVAAFEHDVKAMKAIGFNGVRKHQKIEDPYFYYYCDKLGLLVWEEMPSPYTFGPQTTANLLAEWQRAIRRDYNHPAIMAWVPVNESWGFDPLGRRGPLRQQAIALLQALYHLTKALDPTRLVVSNDGWEQATTDLVTIHEYTQDAADLAARYQRFQQEMHSDAFSHRRPTLLPEVPYAGQPILITEFGGCKVAAEGQSGWGYGEAARDYDEMLGRIRALVQAIRAQASVCGFCYTQLTDVEQEVNGLMFADHRLKVPAEQLRQAFEA